MNAVVMVKKPEFVKISKKVTLRVEGVRVRNVPLMLVPIILLLIRAAPMAADAVAGTARSIWSIMDLATAVVGTMLVIYIGYMVISQIKQATNVTLPGTSENMASMVWQFLVLMVFVAIAAGMIGFFVGFRRA